jgi:tetratricopeptide (TPR) repeat protein
MFATYARGIATTSSRRGHARSAPAPPAPATGGDDAVIAAVLAVLTIAAYARIWTLGFVSFDDPGYVTENPHVLAGLRWSGIVWAFTTNTEANWHPITWLSLMVDASLGGGAAAMFHTTNLLLHVANTLLLFLGLARMTDRRWESAMVAALFAVHPLHVESVAWVAERKDVLSTLFWFLTVGAYVRWIETPTAARYAAMIVAYALGLMAKPMLITLPATLLLLDVWPLARWSRAAAGRLLIEKLPLFALAVGSALVTLVVQRPAMAVLEAVPFPARVGNALMSIVAYAAQMAWPAGLSPIYPYPRDGIPLWQPMGALLLILAASVAVFRERERRPWLPVGWSFYLVTLVPVLGFVQVGYQARADRYTYVPLLGLFVIVVWGARELARSFRPTAPEPRGRAPARRRAAAPAAEHGPALVVLATIVLVALAIRTWTQVGYWRGSVELFTRAVQVTTDNAYAQYNLSTAYQERGDDAQAILQLREALRIFPRMREAHYNLTRLLMKSGRLDEAAPLVAEEEAWWPSDPQAHVDLGALAALQGRTEDAIRHFTEALRLQPDLPDARHNLDALTAGQFNPG